VVVSPLALVTAAGADRAGRPLRRAMHGWLHRRAGALCERLARHLPDHGPLLDVGSGTGHNALALARHTGHRVVQIDVADLSCIGSAPLRFDGRRLPFGADRFSTALLLFVLHYAADPVVLLAEARRVCRGPILLVQSTYSGPLTRRALAVRELAMGRAALGAARSLHLLPPANDAPLQPRAYFTRARVTQLARRAGLSVVRCEPSTRFGLSRDLYVLA
jgi:SAM-dependent methyltransferase